MNELPEDWEIVKLNEIAEIIMGQSPPSSTYNKENIGLPFFQGKAEFGKRYPEVKIFCSNPKKIAAENDILMSVRAPVGSINIANTDCCIGRGLSAIRSNGKVDFLFLYFFLRANEKKISSKGVGSTFTAINKKSVETIKIPLPPLPTQKKIVAILEKAEKLKGWRMEADELTDELLKSTFLEMFGDPVKNPNEWETVKLGSVCEKIQDGSHFSPKEQTGDFLYITAKNIKPWGIDLSNVTYVSKDFHEQIYKRCDPKKGDVIYIKDGVTAGLAKVNTLNLEFSMLSSIAMIRPKNSIMNSYYIEYYLNHPNIYNRIMERKSGSAITRLILKEIKDIKIQLPPYALQNKFAKIVEEVESARKTQKQSRQHIGDLFNALIQKAFIGELT